MESLKDKIYGFEKGDSLDLVVSMKEVVEHLENENPVIASCREEDGYLVVTLDEEVLLDYQRYHKQRKYLS